MPNETMGSRTHTRRSTNALRRTKSVTVRQRYARAAVETLEQRVLLSVSSFQTVYTFNDPAGVGPTSNVVLDTAGDIYGQDNGGVFGKGSLWELGADGATFTTLASFDGTHWVTPPGQDLANSGWNTPGSPIADVTYQLSSGFSVVDASPTDAPDPSTVLGGILTLRGSLVGAVSDNLGDTFLITGPNTLQESSTALSSDNLIIPPGLTSPPPSLLNNRTITLDASVGSNIVGQLAVDSHSNIYGVVASGGANGDGGIFELHAGGGSLQLIASFDGTSSATPTSGVTIDASGNLFGVTSAGGTFHQGNIYEVTPGLTLIGSGSGSVTFYSLANTLASFTGDNGSVPVGPLVFDSQGNLFGTTSTGGTNGDGTLFEVAAGTHQLSTVLNFTGANGANPQAGLTAVSPTALYGTTFGAAGSAPTLFELTLQRDPSLSFALPSTPAIGNQPLSPINVTLTDAAGNLDAASTANITLTVFSGNSTGPIVQTLTVPAQNGVATFSSLTLPVGNYTLVATGDSFNAAVQTLSVTPGTPTQLAFITQPSDGFAGGLLAPISVVVEDAFGNVVTGLNTSILFSLSASSTFNFGFYDPNLPPQIILLNPGSSTVATVDNGLSTLSDLAILASGTFTLTASDPSFTSAISSCFTIDNSPTHLVFLTPPHNGIADQTLSNITVAVEDASGNIVTSDQSSISLAFADVPIPGDPSLSSSGTLIINDTTVAASPVLNGQLTVQVQNGIATFSGLFFSESGRYALTAIDGNISFLTSSTIQIGAPGTFLVLLSQPANATISSSLGTVTVAIEDSLGDILTNDNSSVQLQLQANSATALQFPSAQLNGTTTVTAQNGIATFTNLSISDPGTYTLEATADSVTSDVSASVVITGLPSQLVFLSQPTGALQGQSLGTFQVAVEDSSGNIVTTNDPLSPSFITLSYPGANSSSLLVNQWNLFATALVQNGIATFSGLSIKTIGTYTLTASYGRSTDTDDLGLPTVDSAPVQITSSSNHLVFLTQPANALAGQTLGTLQVAVEDPYGNILTNDQSFVTLSLTPIINTVTIDTAPGEMMPSSTTVTIARTISFPDPQLLGTVTAPTQNGIATFTDLYIEDIGAFPLIASDGSLVETTSSPTTISPSATLLTFTSEPSDSISRSSLGNITVAIEDPYGHILTTDLSSIAIGAQSNAPGASPQLLGTLIQTAQNGIAAFDDLSIDSAGTYTLIASGDGATTTSDPFTFFAASTPVLPITDPITDPIVTPITLPIAPVILGAPLLSPVTTIATFTALTGQAPTGALVIDSKGNLYGLTATGGADNLGTLFEISAGTSSIRTLASFTGANGASPSGGLTLTADGNLYGTTTAGGSANDGTIFELAKGSHTIKTRATFTGPNGADPATTLTLDASGDFFGTTRSGGSANDGTAFELPKGTHTIKTLVSFTAPSEFPTTALLLDKQGNLYGATAGSSDGTTPGTLFELLKNKHTLKTLATFSPDAGSAPSGPLVMDAAGNLFGALQNGGSNSAGALFELAKGSTVINTFATFDADEGTPEGGLLIDTSGDLFGTFSDAGTTNNGGIFEVKAGTQTITPLAACDGATTGQYPAGTLLMDKNGTLYGAATTGGASDDGTLFRFTPVPTAVKLLIQKQPAATAKNGIVSLTVAVLDAKGKIITNGNFTLTLFLLKGPAGATADFTPITVSTLDGVATFSDISLPAIAGTYTLEATEPLLKPVTAHPTVVKPLIVAAHR
jgi:uncharacterized repeat protein (TIGR03803 family)